MPEEVIAIFDVGKANKKFLLFDSRLNVVYSREEIFDEKYDDDGFPCDDIERIEKWMHSSLSEIIKEGNHTIRAINFVTYGASLVYLDKQGKRVTPVYNYLKPMPEGILNHFYDSWGGIEEFCRKTASPALGMLNSGLQLLWMKKEKMEKFSLVSSVLHLPQYLSYCFTGEIVSEHTSAGCHTGMWDFDNHKYHPWLKGEQIELPQPVPVSTLFDIEFEGQRIKTGIGILDSSASMVPYFIGTQKQFILVSTGTWCIFMNPFNTEPLTTGQLKGDSLCYISFQQQQVKSSRIIMGEIHDVNVRRMNGYFGVTDEYFKTIKISGEKIEKMKRDNRGRAFFRKGIPADYIDTEVDMSRFLTFADAYHQFMADMADICMESLRLILPADDKTEEVYITGGFSRNEVFVRLLSSRLPYKRVYTSEIENAAAMGAAMVIWENAFDEHMPPVHLGLRAAGS